MSDKRVATIYDYARVCRHYLGKDMCSCDICPLGLQNNSEQELCAEFVTNHIEKANEIILKWCDEHPQKTRQSELLKLFPETKMDDNGVVDLCPNSFKKGFANGKFCAITECDECLKRFWLEEIETND